MFWKRFKTNLIARVLNDAGKKESTAAPCDSRICTRLVKHSIISPWHAQELPLCNSLTLLSRLVDVYVINFCMRSIYLLCHFLNQFPGRMDMACLGVGLANAKPKGQLVI